METRPDAEAARPELLASPGRRDAGPTVPASLGPERAAPAELPPEPVAAPGQVPLSARAFGAVSLARDILVQSLDGPALRRVLAALDGLAQLLRAGVGTGGGLHLDVYGKDPELVRRLEPLLGFLYERYWRVAVENAALLPAGPAILVANHGGALPLDGPVLAQAIRRERPELGEPRWLLEDQIFYAPFWGTLFNRLGAVRASPENATCLLGEGRAVLVFPEGMQGTGKPFSERYRLKRFGRGGFVKLAMRTGAPIVPVAIVGAEETVPVLGTLPGGALGLPFLPITGPLPLPAKWLVRFGPPIPVRPPEGDELAFVQQLTERTRSEIEAMLQSLLRSRRNVFSG